MDISSINRIREINLEIEFNESEAKRAQVKFNRHTNKVVRLKEERFAILKSASDLDSKFKNISLE